MKWRWEGFQELPSWAKVACALGGGLVIGVGTYAALVYYEKRKATFHDEGFEETIKIEENPERRILVLGLDGAGKSTFLSYLTKSENEKKEHKPTEGFNVTCLQKGNTSLTIWEVGGGKNVQTYWSHFLQDTDLLVFVVDSSDEKRLPQAYDAFHNLRGDERLKNVPILVLANKQDLPNALEPKEVEKALALSGHGNKTQHIKVLALQVPPGKPPHPSIWDAEHFIFKMSKK